MPIGRFIVIAAMVLGLGLSACGRKGPLAPPPGPDDVPEGQVQKQDPEPKESKGFLLDFLIQ